MAAFLFLILFSQSYKLLASTSCLDSARNRALLVLDAQEQMEVRGVPGVQLGESQAQLNGQGVRVVVEQTTTRRSRLVHPTNAEGFRPSEIDFQSARAHLAIHEPGTDIAGSVFSVDGATVEQLIREGLPDEIHYDADGRAEITLSILNESGAPVPIGYSLVAERSYIDQLNDSRVHVTRGQRMPGGERGAITLGDGTRIEGAYFERQGGFKIFEPDALLAEVPQDIIEQFRTNRITVVIQKDAESGRPRVLTAFAGDNAPAVPVRGQSAEGNIVFDIDPSSISHQYWRGENPRAFIRVRRE